MNQPLVSILMPIYNCAKSGLRDGKCYLNHALESLLAQSYKNFELLILDNRSEDSTPDICRKYASVDARIQFITDTQKRTIDDAFAYLPEKMRGVYCMCANDDDRYHPEFVSRLVEFLESNKEIDLVYPNCDFVDSVDQVTNARVVTSDSAYQAQQSAFTNFCRYSQRRNPLPFVFGMYRADVFKKIQPTTAFDVWGANVDNLLILKFFLMGFRSAFLDQVLFYYRAKHRPLAPEDQNRARFPRDFPDFAAPVEVWFYYVRHQLYFRIAVLRALKQYNTFSPIQAQIARAVLNESLIRHSMNLMEWLAKDETKVDDVQNAGRFAAIREFAQAKLTGLATLESRLSASDYAQIDSNLAYAKMRSIAAQELLQRFDSVLRFAWNKIDNKESSVIAEVMKLMSEELECFPKVVAASEASCNNF
ncbi:MAG: glycosyltransferase family 2 protein [Oligoflexia bacterium]|nr:glycosyltransferase family 2 protein [Oligoflexia bacterium]